MKDKDFFTMSFFYNRKNFMTRRVILNLDLKFLQCRVSGVTSGGRQGAECPQRLLIREFLLTYQEKKGKENGENGVEKKENQKREGGKLKME